MLELFGDNPEFCEAEALLSVMLVVVLFSNRVSCSQLSLNSACS